MPLFVSLPMSPRQNSCYPQQSNNPESCAKANTRFSTIRETLSLVAGVCCTEVAGVLVENEGDPVKVPASAGTIVLVVEVEVGLVKSKMTTLLKRLIDCRIGYRRSIHRAIM